MATKQQKASKAKEEGVVWVSSTSVYYESPEITADKIRDYSRNIYGADLTQKLRSILFTEKYSIEVFGPNGEPDEALAKRLTLMFDQQNVRFWPKMQMAWIDTAWWGAALFNPVWEWIGNEYWLTKLRRLPPESFTIAPTEIQYIYSHILQGITLNEKGEAVFYQTDATIDAGVPKPLSNVFMLTDPSTGELAGRPNFLPLIPIIGMLDFCWQAQMQKINRVGSPPILIKVVNPQGDDVDYAQKFLNNWGKDTQMQLRQNMETVDLKLVDNDAALATIDALWGIINRYGSPTSLISQGEDRTLIGGSNQAELELMMAYIRGIHSWLCEGFERLLQTYLDANGYVGYTVRIYLPTPSTDKAEIWLKQAQQLFQMKAGTLNELRDLLERDELDEDGKQELMDEWIDERRKVRAEWIKMVMESNKLDPFWMFTPDEARAFMEIAGKAPQYEPMTPPAPEPAPVNEEEEEEIEEEQPDTNVEE